MKAIILAAGSDSRLRPVTYSMPKAMISVKGRPLLYRTMDELTGIGVSEIIIVTGHMSDYIEGRIGSDYKGVPVKYSNNFRYSSTGSLYSLYMALDQLSDDQDVMLSECDVLFSSRLLESVYRYDADMTVAVSYFNDTTMRGHVVSVADLNKITDIYPAEEQTAGFDYSDKRKTANICKISGRFAQSVLKPTLRKCSADIPYQDALRSIFRSGEYDIRAVNVPENWWIEIDDLSDLKRAEVSDL